jgi:CBS domain containing-hemolysin-like protein
MNTAVATSMFISMFGIVKGEVVSAMVMVPLLLLVGEIIPKTIFRQHAEEVAPRISWFIWIASWILYPIVLVISKISRSAVYVLSQKGKVSYVPYITKAGLKFLLRNEKGGSDIMESEKEMIQKILDFSDSTVSQIMIPLSNVTALPEKTTLEEAASIISEKGYFRTPIYSNKVFNITGILHSFDLMNALHNGESESIAADKNATVDTYMRRNIMYVPETKPSGELFFELQKKGEHMSVVIDEYGGATGIVTIEDILEEIVGEVGDEYYSDNEKPYRKVGNGRYIFSAKTKIDQIRNMLSLKIPDGDYETLGGFLLHKAGRVPKRRETFKQGRVLFVVEDADMKSIKEVLVILPASRREYHEINKRKGGK